MSLIHGLCSCHGGKTAYSGQWWWTGRLVNAPSCAACGRSPQYGDLKQARTYLKSLKKKVKPAPKEIAEVIQGVLAVLRVS